MPIKRWLAPFVALLSIALYGAGSCGDGSTGEIVLNIFHTNDIHSHMRAAKSVPFGLGGLARLSTLLQDLRKSHPVSVTLDAGDWSEGSWYFSVDAGSNMLRLFNAMGYDAACLGNHDFLAGPDQIIQTITRAQGAMPVLAANLDTTHYEQGLKLAEVLPESYIKEVGGLKVGFIGLTTFGLVYDSYLAPVQITNPVDRATAVAKKLRSSVDVLILISHNSFEYNMELARAVPGLDAVISGHSHLKVPAAVLVKNAGRDVPVVETGEWAEFLGHLTLTVDRGKKWVRFKDYLLHSVTPSIPEDPIIAQMINAEDQKLTQRFGNIDEVLADSEIELNQSDKSETAMGSLVVKAYRAATGAEVAIEEQSLLGVSTIPGSLTLRDLHDIVPHIYSPVTGKEWQLYVWNARGSDLALAYNLYYSVNSFSALGSGIGWLTGENIEIHWDPSRRGGDSKAFPAIKEILISGKPLVPQNRYQVALSDGFLRAITMANQLFHIGVDLSQLVPTGIEAWQAVVDYAKATKHLRLDDLRVGSRSKAVVADLAIMDYDLSWDSQDLAVTVENQGLLPATGATVTCFSGLRDDFVVYKTDFQKWTTIGQVQLPEIVAGGSVSVRIAWSQARLQSGYWPVLCRAEGDAFKGNNEVMKVFSARVSPR